MIKNTALLRKLLFSAILAVLPLKNAYSDFTTVSGTDWDETAVRKVLHTFSLGGFAPDTLITKWADMDDPALAITEILSLEPSPSWLPTPEAGSDDESLQTALFDTDGEDRTLEGLQDLWSSDDPQNSVPTDYRSTFALASSTQFRTEGLKNLWVGTTNKYGINTFRQRVGLWLTNYQMSTHMQAIDKNTLMLRTLYDESMAKLAEGGNFAETLSVGASSSAIAYQYGHRYNKYDSESGVLTGNDDFAREYHQLFFGISGLLDATDPNAIAYKDYYENITVENTAKLLTGMSIIHGPLPEVEFKTYSNHIDFNSSTNITFHHLDDLEVINFGNEGSTNITGLTAKEKINNLSLLAINDMESEQNLPVKIISHFADDTLQSLPDNDTKITAIRDTWISTNKNLLAFLRKYAISTQFHSASRIKYLNSFERNMIALNKNTVNNTESYQSDVIAKFVSRMHRQGAELFYPAHFVFGGQTGIDAINNPNVFKEAYNSNISNAAANDGWFTLAKTQNSETGWEKDWSQLIPTSTPGSYETREVALWLWNHFIGDGGANYGLQEEAQITSLLAHGLDFQTRLKEGYGSMFYNEDGYSSEDLADARQIYQLVMLVNGNTILPLVDSSQREETNERIGLAVNFITATPYMFVQEGR